MGWAGHYEEVDYSKEVVFEDSSDEDSPKEEKKEQTRSVSVDSHVPSPSIPFSQTPLSTNAVMCRNASCTTIYWLYFAGQNFLDFCEFNAICKNIQRKF